MSDSVPLILLGSTGSIGRQTLEVAESLGRPVEAMSAGHQVTLFEEQIRKFHPIRVAMSDEEAAKDLKIRIADLDVAVSGGDEAVAELSGNRSKAPVLNAIMGVAGLRPTLYAIENGHDVILSNKESLVSGGALVAKALENHHRKLIPVDSEHSAIFQCLQTSNGRKDELSDQTIQDESSTNKRHACAEADTRFLSRIWLTCSGGPFFGKTIDDLKSVTPEQALRHPKWNMGGKITIDSATLFNKGFEMIEAAWLFGVELSDITVVIHPESVLHSAVELIDGSIIGQMGVADMKIPIRYGLTYPNRGNSDESRLNFFEVSSLHFYEPDEVTFPAMEICRKAFSFESCAMAAICSGDEEAVRLFCENRLSFTDISKSVRSLLENNWPKNVTLNNNKLVHQYRYCHR